MRTQGFPLPSAGEDKGEGESVVAALRHCASVVSGFSAKAYVEKLLELEREARQKRLGAWVASANMNSKTKTLLGLTPANRMAILIMS